MHQEWRGRFTRLRLQRKPLVNDPGMHPGTCVTHVPGWMWQGKHSRHSGCMHSPQFYISGKRPIAKCHILQGKNVTTAYICNIYIRKNVHSSIWKRAYSTISRCNIESDEIWLCKELPPSLNDALGSDDQIVKHLLTVAFLSWEKVVYLNNIIRRFNKIWLKRCNVWFVP